MRPRKPKANEPSPRDKLSAAFLKAFQTDFDLYGVEVIEQLRKKSPEKYAELAARLIATVEPKPDGFEQCNSMEDIGRKLLQFVGLDANAATPSMIEAAIEANDAFIKQLKRISQGN